MKKRNLTLLLTLLLCMVGLNVYAQSEEYKEIWIDDVQYRLNLVAKTAALIDAYKDGTFIIPEKVTDNETEYTVTRIGDYAFSDQQWLYGITIPNTIKSIGMYAFYRCRHLGSLSIPESVEDINPNCLLLECEALTVIEVSEGNPKYDSRNKCNAIVETATNTLIAGCNYSKIPYGIDSIGAEAFRDCRKLNTTIPATVKKIGAKAFDGTALKAINIPNSVTEIGESAFSWCDATSLTIGTGLKSISNYAFSGCIELTSITIPDNVTSIGDDAFYECDGLTTVSLPETLTHLGKEAFQSCDKLTTINIPNSVTKLSDGVFSGCPQLTSLPLHNKITSIGAYAFADCGFSTFVIPNSVTEIGRQAFYGCKKLTAIEIPNTVTTIHERTFDWCSALTTVTLPNSITTIELAAFAACNSLTTFTVPNSVKVMGDAVFQFCENLTSIVLGSGLISIGGSAFDWCEKLSVIVSLVETPFAIPGKVPDYADFVFPNIVFDEATLFVPTGSLSLYQACNGWKDFANICEGIPSDPTNIQKVETPSISGEKEFQKSTQVTITCSTEGASIQYCTSADGENYTDYQPYTAPFTITETTYVKAKASKNGMIASDEGTETFVKKEVEPGIPTIAEARAAGSGKSVTTQGIVTTCTVAGTKATAFIQDATAAICVYAESTQAADLVPGNIITVSGTTNVWRYLYRIDSPTITVVSTGNAIPEPEVITIADIFTDMMNNTMATCKQGKLVKIENAKVTRKIDSHDWWNAEICQGDQGFFVNGLPLDASFEEGDKITVVGNIAANTDLQLFNPTLLATVPPSPGDANGDDKIDVADVVAIVNYILGEPDEGFNEKVCDLNGDGKIDIEDVVALVNIILGA